MSSVLFDEKLFQIKEEISDEEKENDENTGYLSPEDIFFFVMLKKFETKPQDCHRNKLKIILNRLALNVKKHIMSSFKVNIF